MVLIRLILTCLLASRFCIQTITEAQSLVKLSNKEYCRDSKFRFRRKRCTDIKKRPSLCSREWIGFLCPNKCDPGKSRSISMTVPNCCKDYGGEFPFRNTVKNCTDFESVDNLELICRKKKWLRDLCPVACGACTPPEPTKVQIDKKEKMPFGMIENNTYVTLNQPLQAKLKLFGPESVKKYTNCDEFRSDLTNAASIIANEAISRNAQYHDRMYMVKESAPMTADIVEKAEESLFEEGEDSYETNVQVEGIDEADIVKSTSTTVYAAYGDKLVVWDALTLKVLSVTKIQPEQEVDRKLLSLPYRRHNYQKVRIRGLLLYKDRLAVIASYNKMYYPYRFGSTEDRPIFDDKPTTLYLYDVSNIIPGGLKLISKKRILGDFKEARLIGNNAHIITSTNVGDSLYGLMRDLHPYFRPDLFAKISKSEYISNATNYAKGTLIPTFVEKFLNETASNDLSCTNFHRVALFHSFKSEQPHTIYEDPRISSIMNGLIQIVKFDMESTDVELGSSASSFLLPNAYGTEIYASGDKLVLASRGNEIPLNGTRWNEATFIQVLSLDSSNETNNYYGVVSGHLLNQYSMDLWDGHLRLATTKSAVWGCVTPKELPDNDTELIRRPCNRDIIIDSDNFMHVLRLPTNHSSHRLEQTGYLNNLGKTGERIYSVRFMGNKAFVVTFLQTDPFYTIDMSNHTYPKKVGELEIPGFSNYLHPYDREGNLIIGVGQDADKNGIVTGLQISLFNATDFSNATLIQSYNVEQENGFNKSNLWSTSEAQYEPKAFRFLSNSKKLILPISIKNDINFDGFLVFDLHHQKIAYSFNISHVNPNQMDSLFCWYHAYMPSRSLVHQGIVTTIKGHTVLTHQLDAPHQQLKSLNLDEKNQNNSDCATYWLF